MRWILVLFMLAALFGCDSKKRRIKDGREVVSTITFHQEKRSGLCFAVYYFGGGSGGGKSGLSWVPCDKVKHLIKRVK